MSFFANSDFNSLGSKHSRWTTTFPALFFPLLLCCRLLATEDFGLDNVHVTNSEKNGSPTIRRNINTLATIRRIVFSRTSSTFGLISLLLTKFLLNSFDLMVGETSQLLSIPAWPQISGWPFSFWAEGSYSSFSFVSASTSLSSTSAASSSPL